MFLHVLFKRFQVPVPVVWKVFNQTAMPWQHDARPGLGGVARRDGVVGGLRAGPTLCRQPLRGSGKAGFYSII